MARVAQIYNSKRYNEKNKEKIKMYCKKYQEDHKVILNKKHSDRQKYKRQQLKDNLLFTLDDKESLFNGD